MTIFDIWLDTDLQKPLQVALLPGVFFAGDDQANRINVRVTSGGEAAPLSGTVTAYAIRSDESTLILTGALSGSTVSVLLPEAAYAKPGPLDIVIKLISGDQRTAIGACRAYVARTSTDAIVDPGHVIPSLEELLALIERMEQDMALIEGMTAAAHGLDTLQPPTVTVTREDGHFHLDFGIPKGATGDGSVSSVNGYAPDSQGNVTIPTATAAADGLLSAGDKGKLNNLSYPLPVSKGGTGRDTLPVGEALIGSGTFQVATRAIVNMTESGAVPAGNSLVTANTLRNHVAHALQDYVLKAGDVMTGSLGVKDALNLYGSPYISLSEDDAPQSGATAFIAYGGPERTLYFEIDYGDSGQDREHYYFPTPSGSGSYDILTTKNAVAASQGGTGQSAYDTGDILYASGANRLARLPGNTAATRKFLRMAGTGSAAAAPAWDTLTADDIPDLSGSYLPLAGGTLTGPLVINSGENFTSISLRGAPGAPHVGLSNTGSRLTIDEYADGSTGGERYLLPIPDAHDRDVWQTILTTKPQANVYTRLCPGVNLTTTPSAQSNNDVIRFYDVNSRGFGYIGGTQYTNGQTNVTVAAYRTINGTTIYNGLTLGIQPDGTRVVAFSNQSPWLSALGLVYERNDTISETNTALTGIMRNQSKQFILRVETGKSLANISTITVNTLSGWIGSRSGAVGGSTDGTNWLTLSGVTQVYGSKKSENSFVIVINTSSALANAANGPIAFYGSFKVTLT